MVVVDGAALVDKVDADASVVTVVSGNETADDDSTTEAPSSEQAATKPTNTTTTTTHNGPDTFHTHKRDRPDPRHPTESGCFPMSSSAEAAAPRSALAGRKDDISVTTPKKPSRVAKTTTPSPGIYGTLRCPAPSLMTVFSANLQPVIRSMRHVVVVLGALCLAVWCWTGWMLLTQPSLDPHATYTHQATDRAAQWTGLFSHLLESLP